MAGIEEQIDLYNLPARPTIRIVDPERCVEIDAIPLQILKELVRDVIESHIDQYALDFVREIER